MHQWAQDTLFLSPFPLPERWKFRNHPALVWSRSENPARAARQPPPTVAQMLLGSILPQAATCLGRLCFLAATQPDPENDKHGTADCHPGDISADVAPKQRGQKAGDGRSRGQDKCSKDTYPQVRTAGRAMHHDGTGARLANASARAEPASSPRQPEIETAAVTAIVAASSAAQISCSGMPPIVAENGGERGVGDLLGASRAPRSHELRAGGRSPEAHRSRGEGRPPTGA